ncbi:MAG: hypothetical protein GY724_23125 [Actinomycetia bacterium]|nr:hypothetical protein [Actinomycetes bacterium]MCP5035436.1 hypothetical protein [Actinomycetes bacterium]
MTRIQFQGPLTGTLRANLIDNNGDPARVLEASKNFEVKVKWKVDVLAAQILGGTWQIDLYAESIGDGFEGQLTYDDVPVVANQQAYQTTLVVPAGKLQNDPPPPPPTGRISGAYKLALVLSHRNSAGTTTWIAGLVEFPVVLIR